MPLSDLTGVWTTEDGGGYYYIQQLQDEIWWVGMSAPWRFHPGVDWTNVFHGRLNRTTNSIEGVWADVPRGRILQNGTLTIDIVQVAQIAALAVSTSAARRPPNGNGDSGGGHGQRQTLELHKRPGTGGPFGTSVWRPGIPFSPLEIGFRFDNTRRNDGGTMHDHLKMYKDYTVVFGDVVETLSVGFPPTARPNTNADPNVPRDYCSFIDAPWWDRGFFGNDDPPDGDINFQVRIDRADLDGQPNFWSEDWHNAPDHIRNKLNNNSDNKMNQMHPEIIMYGRDKDADHCHEDAAVLLPGWQDSNGNSILLNGRPIEGQVDFGPPVRLLGREIVGGSRVRVIGFLALDCHGLGGDCEEDHPTTHNVEIHPTYSIDILQDFNQPRLGSNLTGVWHANDVGTYYIRQIDNTIWWLGLSRDQGQRFANVFQGTIAGNTITGQWADVPVGPMGARNSGTLNLTGDGRGGLSTALTGGGPNFGGNRWIKLYDSGLGLVLGPVSFAGGSGSH